MKLDIKIATKNGIEYPIGYLVEKLFDHFYNSEYRYLDTIIVGNFVMLKKEKNDSNFSGHRGVFFDYIYDSIEVYLRSDNFFDEYCVIKLDCRQFIYIRDCYHSYVYNKEFLPQFNKTLALMCDLYIANEETIFKEEISALRDYLRIP